MKTERLYYTDGYLTDFSANVVDAEDSGRRIYLDRTAFYPNSGGQCPDLGTISGIEILDIVDEDDRIAHVVADPITEAEVECRIDWNRRFDHMQQHTGQHLLSAVLIELFGYETVSFHMSDEVSNIELATSDWTEAHVEAAEKVANERVWEARPVNIRFEDASGELGLRKQSKRSGLLRIVEIEGLDRSACGGTHVRSTAEIGPIQIRRAERMRGNTRLEFVCGGRALERARKDLRILQELARNAGTSIDKLPEYMGATREQLASAEKTNERLSVELARRDGLALYAATVPGADGVRRAAVRVGAVDGSIRAQAQAFTGAGKGVFLAIGESPATVLIACSPDSGVNAGSILKQALSATGGRGGGTNVVAQGVLPNSAVAAELERMLGFV